MYKTKSGYHVDFCTYEYSREFELFGLAAQIRETLNPEVKLESHKNYRYLLVYSSFHYIT